MPAVALEALEASVERMTKDDGGERTMERFSTAKRGFCLCQKKM